MCSASSYFFWTAPLNIINHITYQGLSSWRNNISSYCLVGATVRNQKTTVHLYVAHPLCNDCIFWFGGLNWLRMKSTSYHQTKEMLNLLEEGECSFFPCNAVKCFVGQRTDKPQVVRQVRSSCSWGSFTFTLSVNSITRKAQIFETTVPLVKHRLSVTANLWRWTPCTK